MKRAVSTGRTQQRGWAKLRGSLDVTAIERGHTVFQSAGCAECHQPPNYTSADTYDMGPADKDGLRKFNPPTLLGLSQRDSLLHDASAANIYEVFANTQHGELTATLDDQALKDLATFLDSL